MSELRQKDFERWKNISEQLINEAPMYKHNPLLHDLMLRASIELNAGQHFIENRDADVSELRDGLIEAMEWNWLDDDYPQDVFERLHNLIMSHCEGES